MPVYLFTYHAYQSWLPDHRRGFVKKDRGIQPTNKPLADAYRRAAKAESFEFTPLTQHHLIFKARAVCTGDGYRLHGAATEPTHLHALVSWANEAICFSKVRGRIKKANQKPAFAGFIAAGWNYWAALVLNGREPPAGQGRAAFTSSARCVFAAARRRAVV